MFAYDCVFSNLTFSGATNMNAAGLDCSNVTVNLDELTLRNCTSIGNYYGISLPATTARGVPLEATLMNCLVAQNTQDGLYAGHSGHHQDATRYYLYNCTVVDNGGHGLNVDGGASVAPQPTLAMNSLFTGNGGYGVYVDGFVPPYIGLDLDFCLFYGNSSGDWWYDTDAIIGSNMVTNQDPKYYSGNYRLKSTSPGMNTGTNQPWMATATGLGGNERIVYDIVDMGAYENITPPRRHCAYPAIAEGRSVPSSPEQAVAVKHFSTRKDGLIGICFHAYHSHQAQLAIKRKLGTGTYFSVYM